MSPLILFIATVVGFLLVSGLFYKTGYEETHVSLEVPSEGASVKFGAPSTFRRGIKWVVASTVSLIAAATAAFGFLVLIVVAIIIGVIFVAGLFALLAPKGLPIPEWKYAEGSLKLPSRPRAGYSEPVELNLSFAERPVDDVAKASRREKELASDGAAVMMLYDALSKLYARLNAGGGDVSPTERFRIKPADGDVTKHWYVTFESPGDKHLHFNFEQDRDGETVIASEYFHLPVHVKHPFWHIAMVTFAFLNIALAMWGIVLDIW